MDDAPDRPRYHHGDLRAGLLAAAEAELAAFGVEQFSLRAVAKRAGVSHAAPAHHFGDVGGLLTALAADGYRRFVATLAAHEPPGADAHGRALGAGLGYVAFARSRPALFRLIFASARPDHSNPDLRAAAEVAYAHLLGLAEGIGGDERDAAALWAMAHGLADLALGGRLNGIMGLPDAERDAAVAGLLARVLPQGRTAS
jgi:AcrR family transcriptional regulator